MKKKCRENPKGVHCFHVESQSTSAENGKQTLITTQICCYCGERVTRTFENSRESQKGGYYPYK